MAEAERRRTTAARKAEKPEGVSNLMSYKVFEAMRADILDGRMTPGSRIRQEDLAAKYGVSRIPVREALHLLESNGLVVLKANSGAWVAALDLAEFVEVYKIRERVEPLALEESLPRLSDAQITAIIEMRERVDAATGVDDFLFLDREFHLMTYAGARLPRLSDMINRFWNSTQHYRRVFTTQAGEEGRWIINSEHRLLTIAIERRDVKGASEILRGHIRRTRKDLERRADSLGFS